MKKISLMKIILLNVVSSVLLLEPVTLLAKSYIDLSHEEEAQMPVDPALKLPEMKLFSQVNSTGSKFNLEIISFCPHTGTHMDAPFHVNPKGHSIEAWKEDVLIGPAVVVSVGQPGNYEITKDDIIKWESKYGEIKHNEGVLLNTGHSERWNLGYDGYIKKGYPTISIEAAKYLVSKKIRCVAVEAISPEKDSSDIHRIFMDCEIPVIENICNLSSIRNQRVKTVGTFPAVRGATGVWVRLLVEKT